MIDVTKPLRLADGTPVELMFCLPREIVVRVHGRPRSFEHNGVHYGGELPNLENVPDDQRVRDAAPELLAALKEVKARGLPDRYQSDAILIEQVNAAIAKAEGGAS